MIYRLFSFQHTFFYFYLILCVARHTWHTWHSGDFSSPIATQSLDITTFLKFSTQKTHKKQIIFFVFFLSNSKSIHSVHTFKTSGFAFLFIVFIDSLRSLLLLFQGALDNRNPRLQTKKNVSRSLSSFTTPFSSLFLPCLLFKYLSRHNRF